MVYEFGIFELDLAAFELRAEGLPCKLEPQVFSLLALLVENNDRLVSKDEIIDKVWDGRVVSDSAVASRVKSARQALGDNGRAQCFIKTIHGKGFRFVADLKAIRRGVIVDAAAPSGTSTAGTHLGSVLCRLGQLSRPSLAVLPFRMVAGHERHAALAGALPDELISELSRLRWLFVTARGSSFRLRADSEYSDIGRLLGVRYCLSGTIEVSDRRLLVVVKLVDTRDGGIVWADRFSGRIDDVHSIRADICSRVLLALDIQVPMHEAALARLTAPDDLDAWSAYHLGLQHIYRFNRSDNAVAARLFQRAVSLDSRFARAHAGLSFVHFQTAFMNYADDRENNICKARECAERGLALDPLDPFVNFTMGRSFWLEGDLDGSLGWLERATELCPNYAQGIYARAWSEALGERPSEARTHIDLAMRLSPIDPLYYAMMATRSFTHMVRAEDSEAVDWAERGARAPGAHVLIAMIAAVAQFLAGNPERAQWWAANVRERNGALGCADFFRAFPMTSHSTRERVARALQRLGF